MRIVDTGRHKWKLVLNTVVLILAFAGVAKREFDVDQPSFFERVLIDTFGPIQEVVSDVHGGVRDFFRHYLLNVTASKENVQLKNQIATLNRDLFQYKELERENLRLKDLLTFGETLQQTKVLAQVVSWDSTAAIKVIRINKGSEDGVRLQSVVVTAEGLVGYVYRLTSQYSDILTVLDANNRVDGIIARSRSHGIVEGDSNDRCIMKFVNRTEPIKLGDVVVTSGLGYVYPKGIRVGRVSKIERASYGITQYIEIVPSVDFNKLEEVVVLVDKNNEKLKREWRALNESDVQD